MRALKLIYILSLFAIIFQNCGGVNFSASDSPNNNSQNGPGASGQGGGTCPLQSLNVPIKLIFVVDTSGSNVKANMDFGTLECTDKSGVPCTPATDPDKNFRGGSISSFFNSYKAKSNFSWGFNIFSSGSQTLINGKTQFGNASSMQNAINLFYNTTDDGGTSYEAALSAVQAAISNDPDIHSTAALAPLYYIIFMSDGYPSDILNSDGSIQLSKLDQDILAITSLAPSRIRLNTVYYGTINDPAAAKNLNYMANKGNGLFLNIDTATTKSIAIDDLIQIPSSYCH